MLARWLIPALLFPIATVAVAAEAPATTAPAEEKPPTLAEEKAKQQVAALAEIAKLPVVNASKISDVFALSLRDNDLVLTTKFSSEDAIVRIPGMPGISHMRVMPSQVDASQIAGFEFSNVDFTVPDYVAVHTTIGMAAGQVSIFRQYQPLEDETYTIQLIQHPEVADGEPRVMFYVQQTGPQKIDIKRNASNVVELRRLYPAEVARYIDPIFRTLKQDGFLARIEPRLAWQVFADAYDPPADLKSRVRALVAQLDAEQFRDREKASAELEQLGEPGALTVMRLDRSKFSEEQTTRLDAFLSKFKLISEAEVARLRTDRDFLLDCLNSDEAPIRQAALKSLREVTGKDIQFDLAGSSEDRLAAIAQLRDQFGTSPATQTAAPQ